MNRVNVAALAVLLVACSKPSQPKPESAPPASAEVMQQPSRFMPVRRDWHGITLSTSFVDAVKAADAAGYAPKWKCGSTEAHPVDWYGAATRQVTKLKDIASVQCKLIQKPKVAKGDRVGVEEVELVFLAEKLFSIELSFGDRETFDGVKTTMAESLGAPTWGGTITESIPWQTDPRYRTTSYEGQTWEDATTAIVLLKIMAGYTPSPGVTYYDLSQLAALRQLEASAVNAAKAAAEAKRQATKSKVTF